MVLFQYGSVVARIGDEVSKSELERNILVCFLSLHVFKTKRKKEICADSLF